MWIPLEILSLVALARDRIDNQRWRSKRSWYFRACFLRASKADRTNKSRWKDCLDGNTV